MQAPDLFALLAAFALALGPARTATAQPLPQVRVLATGGTIAGAGAANSASYRPGEVPVSALLAALPGIEAIAAVSGEQVANIPSGSMNEAIWRTLHARVLAGMAEPGLTGVVITHGTDTLEETAFFLSLVLAPAKPVVLVGSMRPSTAVSADGPQNLMDAIRVAAAPMAASRGVMVVMNDTIFDPVSVTKVDVNRVGAFAAPSRGPIGEVLQPTPRFFGPPARPAGQFALGEAKLPKVAIIYAYAGLAADDVRHAAKDAAGVVIAGVGAGGMSRDARVAVRELTARGIPVVRTARQGFGDVWPADAVAGDYGDAVLGTIAGRELTPAKARILLMLALQQKRSFADLQRLFDQTMATPG
jgi:L-asparaginase